MGAERHEDLDRVPGSSLVVTPMRTVVGGSRKTQEVYSLPGSPGSDVDHLELGVRDVSRSPGVGSDPGALIPRTRSFLRSFDSSKDQRGTVEARKEVSQERGAIVSGRTGGPLGRPGVEEQVVDVESPGS